MQIIVGQKNFIFYVGLDFDPLLFIVHYIKFVVPAEHISLSSDFWEPFHDDLWHLSARAVRQLCALLSVVCVRKPASATFALIHNGGGSKCTCNCVCVCVQMCLQTSWIVPSQPYRKTYVFVPAHNCANNSMLSGVMIRLLDAPENRAYAHAHLHT